MTKRVLAMLEEAALVADREPRKLHALLESGQRTPESTRALVDGYAQLVTDTQAMIAASTQLTQRAIERLQQTASQGRETWLYVGLASLVIAIGLAILVVFYRNRGSIAVEDINLMKG